MFGVTDSGFRFSGLGFWSLGFGVGVGVWGFEDFRV